MEVKENINIVSSAKKLCDFLISNQIEAIVLSGNSSIVSKTLLNAAIKHFTDGTYSPKIFTISNEGNFVLYKQNGLELLERSHKAKQWLEQNLPELFDYKNKKICFLDEVMITGEKMEIILFILKVIGFNYVYGAVFASFARNVLPQDVFVGSINYDLLTCLFQTSSRILGNNSIDDSDLPEQSEEEIKKRGQADLKNLIDEISNSS